MAKITRRQFVKGAVVGAAAVTAAGAVGALSGCGAPKEAGIPDKWDKEADVIVAGTGTVSAATLVAADAGLKVLVLEKAPVYGGHTSYSGGALWIPNNYLLREAGLAETRESVITYMKHVSEGQSTDELIEAFVDNCTVATEWLRDKYNFQWQNRPTGTPDYFTYPGASVSGRSISPLRADGVTSGAALIKNYVEALTPMSNVEIMLETRARRLIYKGDSNKGDGEVIGVIAESGGEEIACKARHGVVIGTGSFDHNKDLRQHYLRGPIFGTCSAPTNTGDGLLMAQAVGADLRNMNECWGLPVYLPVDPVWTGVGDAYPGQLPLPGGAGAAGSIVDWYMFRGKPGAITVNRKGVRFMNESSNYDASSKAFYKFNNATFEWDDIPGFVIFAKDYTSHYNLPGQTTAERTATPPVVPGWLTKADTLNELAAALGIDAAALAATVEKFNGYARNGVDPEFKRGESPYNQRTAGDLTRKDAGELKNACLAVLEPPYYGAKLWPGTCGSCGGPKTNGNAQALNVWGKVIPRLYVTSNTMASVMGSGYGGAGGTLGPGTTFGYLAGKHVATLQPWG